MVNSLHAVKQREAMLHCLPVQVEANRLLAIMGSSGAGKTTLLDVLACNTFGGAGGGSVTGQVRLRSVLLRPHSPFW